MCTHRARIGSFMAKAIQKTQKTQKNTKILGYGWHAAKTLDFFLLIVILSLLSPFLYKTHAKLPFSSPKTTLGLLALYLFSSWFLLLLAGDIHPNPGPPQHGKLRFGHWNLNSLLAREKAKIPLLEALQSVENFDMFGISESFLNDNTDPNELEIHGFDKNPIRADCPGASNHPKGGVCLYFRENLPIKHRPDLQLLNETIVCEIKIDRNKKLFFVLSYRSPSQDSAATRQYVNNMEKCWPKLSLKTQLSLFLQGTSMLGHQFSGAATRMITSPAGSLRTLSH